MILKDYGKNISLIYQNMKPTLCTNHELLDIYEGNLLEYVLRILKRTLSNRAYGFASERVPPINLLKRLIDKLSTIYAQTPEREVDGSETDKEMWDWYIDEFDLNVQMQLSNEYFNMQKACALEPYLDSKFKPRLRVIPYDRFFVCASDPSDPLRVTHFVKVMGVHSIEQYAADGKQRIEPKVKMILYVYTDTEFMVIDEDGERRPELHATLGNAAAEGINPYGRIPFVYMNRSKTKVNPTGDTDLMQMTTLIPVMLTDINYALMFQAFSIIYTIDVDTENFEFNPNVVISLKSDKQAGTDPKLGTIKPELDSDKAVAVIKEQLGLWLQSRNIRPGASGQLSAETMVSGLSKMVDEMDTTNERKKTIPFFLAAEYELFNLITESMHPIFITNPSFEMKTPFTNGVTESVRFSEDMVVQSRKEIIDETVVELNARLLSRKKALERLNPEMEDDQIDEEIAAIDGDNTVTIKDDVNVDSTSKNTD